MRISPLFMLIGLSFALVGKLVANNPSRLDAALSQRLTPAQPLWAQVHPASAIVEAVTPAIHAGAAETPMGGHGHPASLIQAEELGAPLPVVVKLLVANLSPRS